MSTTASRILPCKVASLSNKLPPEANFMLKNGNPSSPGLHFVLAGYSLAAFA